MGARRQDGRLLGEEGAAGTDMPPDKLEEGMNEDGEGRRKEKEREGEGQGRRKGEGGGGAGPLHLRDCRASAPSPVQGKPVLLSHSLPHEHSTVYTVGIY